MIDDLKAMLLESARRERRAVLAFVASVQSGDLVAYGDAIEEIELRWCWRKAFRALAKMRGPAHPAIVRGFVDYYRRTGAEHLRGAVRNDLVYLDGLRSLLPKYNGGPKRLYRGEHPRNVRYATYGVSWSSSKAIAAQYCCGAGLQNCDGGGIVCSAVVPPEAIIYHVGGGEREYLVDRRRLVDVRHMGDKSC